MRTKRDGVREEVFLVDGTGSIARRCGARADGGHFLGRIFVRELPAGIDEREFLEWWPRLSERERDRYSVAYARNMIMTAGRTQILTFIGSGSSSISAFTQYFAVGTGTIIGVQPTDTILATELFRMVPSTYVIGGTQVTISSFMAAGTATGTWTNAGIFGPGATGTANSGSLMTHTLYSYNKGVGQAITNDYVISLQ